MLKKRISLLKWHKILPKRFYLFLEKSIFYLWKEKKKKERAMSLFGDYYD
jgi:hypothetical protein